MPGRRLDRLRGGPRAGDFGGHQKWRPLLSRPREGALLSGGSCGKLSVVEPTASSVGESRLASAADAEPDAAVSFLRGWLWPERSIQRTFSGFGSRQKPIARGSGSLYCFGHRRPRPCPPLLRPTWDSSPNGYSARAQQASSRAHVIRSAAAYRCVCAERIQRPSNDGNTADI